MHTNFLPISTRLSEKTLTILNFWWFSFFPTDELNNHLVDSGAKYIYTSNEFLETAKAASKDLCDIQVIKCDNLLQYLPLRVFALYFYFRVYTV